MHFTALIIAALTSTILAAPVSDNELDTRAADASKICSGFFSVPQCCSMRGVLDLSCQSPPRGVGDVDGFVKACDSVGKQAVCCMLPILGQNLMCKGA